MSKLSAKLNPRNRAHSIQLVLTLVSAISVFEWRRCSVPYARPAAVGVIFNKRAISVFDWRRCSVPKKAINAFA